MIPAMYCISIYLVNRHVQPVHRYSVLHSLDVIIAFIRKLCGLSLYHGLSSATLQFNSVIHINPLINGAAFIQVNLVSCVFRSWMTFGRRILSGLLFLPILRSLTVMSWRSGGQTHNELIMNMKSKYGQVVKRCVDYIHFKPQQVSHTDAFLLNHFCLL